MPCTYMKTHRRARACSHTIIYACRRVCTHAHICTHRGTSVQRTPSILNPDPGLVSVFTCKWSTTICGPFRLLCPSSRLGLGKWAASQMGGTTSDGLPWLWSQTLQREREEAACLAATETAGTPTYHGSGPWLVSFADWRAGERRKGLSRTKAFLSEDWEQSRSGLRLREGPLMCGLQIYSLGQFSQAS